MVADQRHHRFVVLCVLGAVLALAWPSRAEAEEVSVAGESHAGFLIGTPAGAGAVSAGVEIGFLRLLGAAEHTTPSYEQQFLIGGRAALLYRYADSGPRLAIAMGELRLGAILFPGYWPSGPGLQRRFDGILLSGARIQQREEGGSRFAVPLGLRWQLRVLAPAEAARPSALRGWIELGALATVTKPAGASYLTSLGFFPGAFIELAGVWREILVSARAEMSGLAQADGTPERLVVLSVGWVNFPIVQYPWR